VDSVTADTVVIGGQAFAIINGSEFKDQIQAGNFVKVHFVLNADGTYSIVEIESWDPALVRDGNSNSNSNLNSNSNSNNNSDDHGGNGNGDDDNNSNGNDDSHDDSGNGNSNGNSNGNGNGNG
jgi:hypothetical protein